MMKSNRLILFLLLSFTVRIWVEEKKANYIHFPHFPKHKTTAAAAAIMQIYTSLLHSFYKTQQQQRQPLRKYV